MKAARFQNPRYSPSRCCCVPTCSRPTVTPTIEVCNSAGAGKETGLLEEQPLSEALRGVEHILSETQPYRPYGLNLEFSE